MLGCYWSRVGRGCQLIEARPFFLHLCILWFAHCRELMEPNLCTRELAWWLPRSWFVVELPAGSEHTAKFRCNSRQKLQRNVDDQRWFFHRQIASDMRRKRLESLDLESDLACNLGLYCRSIPVNEKYESEREIGLQVSIMILTGCPCWQ